MGSSFGTKATVSSTIQDNALLTFKQFKEIIGDKKLDFLINTPIVADKDENEEILKKIVNIFRENKTFTDPKEANDLILNDIPIVFEDDPIITGLIPDGNIEILETSAEEMPRANTEEEQTIILEETATISTNEELPSTSNGDGSIDKYFFWAKTPERKGKKNCKRSSFVLSSSVRQKDHLQKLEIKKQIESQKEERKAKRIETKQQKELKYKLKKQKKFKNHNKKGTAQKSNNREETICAKENINSENISFSKHSIPKDSIAVEEAPNSLTSTAKNNTNGFALGYKWDIQEQSNLPLEIESSDDERTLEEYKRVILSKNKCLDTNILEPEENVVKNKPDCSKTNELIPRKVPEDFLPADHKNDLIVDRFAELEKEVPIVVPDRVKRNLFVNENHAPLKINILSDICVKTNRNPFKNPPIYTGLCYKCLNNITIKNFGIRCVSCTRTYHVKCIIFNIDNSDNTTFKCQPCSKK